MARLLSGLLSLMLSFPLLAQTSGPQNGALVVVGGGMRDLTILQTFAELAGGLDAAIVVIPTAGGADEYGDNWRGLQQFRQAGLSNITLLHTYDPQVADSADFVARIEQASGVWFTGGRQWRLVDAYLHNRSHEALQALLDRGGVIGGSSAGATILGSYLARGDSATNTIMMGDHEEGFGFIQNVAIDQHLLRRNRQFDLLEVIEAKPELLGIGLDEDTALVVQGDRFRVIGNSYAVIFDANRTLDSGGRFYFIEPGDEFDLKTRQAYRPQRVLQPLERVTDNPW